MADAGEITRLLQEADAGGADAANRLYALVEEDLRRIARKRKRQAGVGPGLDASTTVLVDDAFCRLVGQDASSWQPGDRRKFFGYVSRQIHDVLIDELRKQQAQKRGGNVQHVALPEEVPLAAPAPSDHGEVLLDLKDALDRLQQFAPDDALLFRLRFFLECTFKEAAEVVGISKTEAVRSYQRTQLWLQRELKDHKA